MAPKLYMNAASGPVRTVLTTANHLGLDLEFQKLDMLNGDHLKPEYVKVRSFKV